MSTAHQNAHQNGLHDHAVPPRSALRSRCSSSATATSAVTEDLPASEIDELTDAPVSDQAVIAAYDNSALLHALAVCDFNPMALAEHLGVSPFALLAWYESDDIQSQIARLSAFERRMLELRSFKSKRLTIEHLEHILETTDDLIEKRRTATTLHRVLSGTRQGGTDLRGVRATRSVRDSERRGGPGHGTPAEPGRASAGGTPETRAPSPTEPATSSLPGRASDHGDDTLTVEVAQHSDPASDPASDPESRNAHKPDHNDEERRIDWDAFTTWPKRTDKRRATTAHALRESAGASRPIPHQRE